MNRRLALITLLIILLTATPTPSPTATPTPVETPSPTATLTVTPSETSTPTFTMLTSVSGSFLTRSTLASALLRARLSHACRIRGTMAQPTPAAVGQLSTTLFVSNFRGVVHSKSCYNSEI